MMTRRTFVKSGACALVALAAPPRFLLRAADAAAGRRKVLVAIFQRGAVDGLSMVPPYGDVAYAAVRPGIAIQPPSHGESERASDLDGFFALHPSLAPLLPLWRNRALAVVHACGSPDTTRSHFDAQDYMETGTPGVKSTPDGWLARAANALPEPFHRSPRRAARLGSHCHHRLWNSGEPRTSDSSFSTSVLAGPRSSPVSRVISGALSCDVRTA